MRARRGSRLRLRREPGGVRGPDHHDSRRTGTGRHGGPRGNRRDRLAIAGLSEWLLVAAHRSIWTANRKSIVFTYGEVSGLNPRTGALEWTYPHRERSGRQRGDADLGQRQPAVRVVRVQRRQPRAAAVAAEAGHGRRSTRSGRIAACASTSATACGSATRVYASNGDFGAAPFVAVDVKIGRHHLARPQRRALDAHRRGRQAADPRRGRHARARHRRRRRADRSRQGQRPRPAVRGPRPRSAARRSIFATTSSRSSRSTSADDKPFARRFRRFREPCTSTRSAMSGSTRVARRAGSVARGQADERRARRDTLATSADRHGRTSNRSVCRNRDAMNAPDQPSASPSRITTAASRRTMPRIIGPSAPSAMRTPISRVRCVVVKLMMP